MESISFSIAGCEIRLLMPVPAGGHARLPPFLCAPGEAPLTVSLLPVQALPRSAAASFCEIMPLPSSERRTAFFASSTTGARATGPYAVGHLEPDGRETIEYLEADRGFFSETANCFSHIALEALLLQWDAMILHASFVSTRYGGCCSPAYPASASPRRRTSGSAMRARSSLTGDRTVLRRMDGAWTAFGSPYAGSSNCFVNESRPVRAIVLLSQGSACSLRRLSPAAAFRGLYAGMTVNLWDDRYVARSATCWRRWTFPSTP